MVIDATQQKDNSVLFSDIFIIYLLPNFFTQSLFLITNPKEYFF